MRLTIPVEIITAMQLSPTMNNLVDAVADKDEEAISVCVTLGRLCTLFYRHHEYPHDIDLQLSELAAETLRRFAIKKATPDWLRLADIITTALEEERDDRPCGCRGDDEPTARERHGRLANLY